MRRISKPLNADYSRLEPPGKPIRLPFLRKTKASLRALWTEEKQFCYRERESRVRPESRLTPSAHGYMEMSHSKYMGKNAHCPMIFGQDKT